MSFTSLETIDYIAIAVDIVILSAFVIYNAIVYTKRKNCMGITVNHVMLSRWRRYLYVAIFATWVIAFTIFIEKSTIRFFFHPVFVVPTLYTLDKSLPTWICKQIGIANACNCDIYEYNDFYPMLALGSIGNLVFAFTTLDLIGGVALLFSLVVLSLCIYYFIPSKHYDDIDIDDKMKVRDIDEIQEFLMMDRMSKKIIVLLDSKCQFCEMQINELFAIDPKILSKSVRLIDMTNVDELDPMVAFSLNINNPENIKNPTSIIFDSGMVVDHNEGLLDQTQLQNILTSF